MQVSNKEVAICSIVLIFLGFGSGYFTKPTEVKEVIKTVTVKDAATDKIVYKERIVFKDGTIKEIESTRDRTSSRELNSTESTKITKNDMGLNLSVLAIAPAIKIGADLDYGIHVTKRILSNVTVGAIATTDKKVGLSIGIEF